MARGAGNFPRWLFIGVLMICGPGMLPAQEVDVPLGHWGYDFIDRLEARGLTELPLSQARPLSRRRFATLLLQIQETHAADLSDQERARLEKLRFQLRDDPAPADSSAMGIEQQRAQRTVRRWLGELGTRVFTDGRNFFAFRRGEQSLFFEPIFRIRSTPVDHDSTAKAYRTQSMGWGYRVSGNFGSHLSYYLDARDATEWGLPVYPRGHRLTWPRYGYAQGNGTSISHDETVAYVRLRTAGLSLTFGKDVNQWGPGRSGALAVNAYATSYDQIKLALSFWRLKFSYFHGALQPYPPLAGGGYTVNGVVRSAMAEKFIAAHRLELFPAPWLRLGIHETVIYGERGLEIAYLNPIMFFRGAEHYLGDRDNVGLGFDWTLRPHPGVLWYGELFIDDFSVSRVGAHWYGNKLAWLAGLRLAGLPPLHAVDWQVEWVHVAPYVYTHTFPVNTYTQYASTLGHPIGPNSRLVQFTARYWAARDLEVLLRWQRQWHGENPPGRNVGGDINRPFDVHDSQIVYFLDGIRALTTNWSAGVQWDFFGEYALAAGVAGESFQRGGRTLRRSVGFYVSLSLAFFETSGL